MVEKQAEPAMQEMVIFFLEILPINYGCIDVCKYHY